MKTGRHIVAVIVMAILLSVVSDSFARSRRSCCTGRTRHSYNCGYQKRSLRRRGFRTRPSYRSSFFAASSRRSRIMLSLPHFRMAFAVPNETIVVAAPQTLIASTTITVWITNDNGSQTAVILTRRGPNFIGPLGEYYSTMPTQEQLKQLYGLGQKGWLLLQQSQGQ